jgi:hypothetical protein
MALRALEEKVALLRRLAAEAEAGGRNLSAHGYLRRAEAAEVNAGRVRRLILDDVGT